MTEFGRLWDLSAFRASFNDLADLDPAEIRDMLRRAWEGNEDDLAERRETRKFWPVIGTLVSIRRRSGLAALTADLVRQAGPRSRPVVSALEEELPESSDEVDVRTIREAQRGVLPVLDDLQIDVDFRIVSSARDGDAESTPELVALVPVVIVRASFDEPVGGHDSIVFQVPDDMIPEVSRTLRSGEQLRSEALRRLPGGLVPKSVVDRLLGERE